MSCKFDFLARVVLIEGMVSVSTWVHTLNYNDPRRSDEEIITESLEMVGHDWYVDAFKLTLEQLSEGIEILFKGRYSGWMSYNDYYGCGEWDEEIDVDDGYEIACFKLEDPEPCNELTKNGQE